MKLLYDMFPLVVFFAAYSIWDIYVATAVAMVASAVQVGHHWFKHRKVELMHMIMLITILVFGGLTLYLQDATFIKWKPSIAYWTLAILIGGSCFTSTTLLQRMLGPEIPLPKQVWLKLNLVWVAFFVALGFLNLYVAFYFGLDMAPELREKIWVYFKFPGTMILTIVFVLMQAPYMARHLPKPAEERSS